MTRILKYIIVGIIFIFLLLIIVKINTHRSNKEIDKVKKNFVISSTNIEKPKESNSSNSNSTYINDKMHEYFSFEQEVENQGFLYKIISIKKSNTIDDSFDLKDLSLANFKKDTRESIDNETFIYIKINIKNISGVNKNTNVGSHRVLTKSNSYELVGIDCTQNHLSKDYFNFTFENGQEREITFLFQIKKEDIDNKELLFRMDMDGSYNVPNIKKKFFMLNPED